MSTSYTTNLKLGQPATGDRGWGETTNTTLSTVDVLAPIAAGCVTLHEVPSASLNVAVAPATVLKSDGTIGTYAGGTSTLNSNTTTYLYLNTGLSLNVNTSSWPNTSHVRLATVTTNSTTVTGVTDARVCLGTTRASSTMPSATATNTWTNTEKTMLQTVYDIVRNLNLG